MGKLGPLQEKKHTRTNDSTCNDKNYAEHCFVWAFTAGFRTNRAHKLTQTTQNIVLSGPSPQDLELTGPTS